jgi:hypothetical protein
MTLWIAIWAQEYAHPFAQSGVVAWPVAFVVFYWVLSKVESEVLAAIASAWHCVALWALAIVAGWECAWKIDAAVGDRI